MNQFRSFIILFTAFSTLLSSCTPGSIPTQPAQPPAEYLSNALDWIETHSVKVNTVDWAKVREQALALAPDPQTTTDTYPALIFVMKQLADSVTFFLTPQELKEPFADPGMLALYPEAIIIGITPGGPADRAGLRIGDVIETINGEPPRQYQGTRFLQWYSDLILQITVRRAGQDQPIMVTLEKVLDKGELEPTGRRIITDNASFGYIELPVTSGGWEEYPTIAQRVIRHADQVGLCGWIIDLRRNTGGDIWSYIAAVGPILGEGQVGSFVYLDGRHEPWTYEGSTVFWNQSERAESVVEGQPYKLKRPMPSVALLTSSATMAAGELAVITFQGRLSVRTFGETTGGSPFLSYWTGLSDGAFIAVSAASSMDRMGRVYDNSIAPDEVVAIDWSVFGKDNDPVILAASDWLKSQPDCAH